METRAPQTRMDEGEVETLKGGKQKKREKQRMEEKVGGPAAVFMGSAK